MKNLVFVLVFVFVLTGCASTRMTTQLVHEVSHDTLYLSNIQYDSIYVDNWHSLEYHPSTLNAQHSTLNRIDTVFITEKSVEYKYRMLRDTVYKVQIDSIPVIKTVEVVKTERYVPSIYKWSLAICIALVIVIISVIVKKLFL